MKTHSPETPPEIAPASMPGEPPPTMVNPVRDLRQLQHHTGATAGELREFLAQLRGKSPAEMLGAVASSNLVRGTVLAAIGTVLLLFLATAIPFALSGDRSDREATTDDASTSAAAADTAAEPASQAAQAPDDEGAGPSEVDPRRTAEILGLGEERHAPADINPLENAVDDLLKDLE